jgi:hypothetical protein
MLKYPTSGGASDYEPVPAGSHIAVCDIVADIGLQPGSALFPKPKQKVYIRFELPNERIEFTKDDKKQMGPMVIGKTYTASMNEKATLRHHLESWRGKAFTDEEAEAFDVSKVLGAPCMLTVMHTKKGDKTYANIIGIGPLPKGVEKKTIIPEIVAILYAPDNTATYQQLPEWLRLKIDEQIVPEKEQPKAQPQGQPLEDGSFITNDDLPDVFDEPQGIDLDFDDSSVPF